MLQQIGELVNTGLQARIKKIKSDLAANESKNELQQRLGNYYLGQLENVNSDKFDFNEHLSQLESGNQATLRGTEAANRVEQQRLEGLLPVTKERTNQQLGYQTGIVDNQTSNQIRLAQERANQMKPFVDAEIEYGKWSKGASDFDKLQAGFAYASGENEKNRQLARMQANRGLVGSLLGGLLTGASMLIG